jgi:prepilin-type N-terminal cleavage/methylation domain-containing protein
MASRSRLGFSLIEMLVATAILLVAVGVLSELADLGRQHARGAEDAASAQRICQNVLEEILCGAMPLESTSETTVSEEPEWTYSVDVESLERFDWEPGLAEVRVTVVRTPEGARPGKPFSLTRWIRYPSGEKTAGAGVHGPSASAPSPPVSRGPRP